MNLLTFQHDYHFITLSRLSGPVQIVERTILDIQVFEGIEGVMEELEEPMVGELDCEIIDPGSQLPAINVDSVDGIPLIVELGAELVSPALTATYNRPPTTAVLNDTEGNAQVDIIADPESFVAPYTYFKTGNNEFVRWTVTAGDGTNTDDGTHIKFWQPRVFWGVGSPLGVGNGTEAFIEALAGSGLQPDGNSAFMASPTVAQKIFFAAPTSFGALQFFLGSPLPGGMFLVGSNISVTPNTPNGVPQDYSLWESVSVGLGPTNVTVTQV